MMLLTFSLLEYFFTHDFTWDIYLKPLPTYKEEKKIEKMYLSASTVVNVTNPNSCEEPKTEVLLTISIQYQEGK